MVTCLSINTVYRTFQEIPLHILIVIPHTGGGGGGRPPSKVQPPDKNQFEREISAITKEIKDKEARMVSFSL